MRLLPLSALLLAPALLAAADKDKDDPISPTLNLLPEGSVLTDVSIPRYDEDRNPSSLLRAGTMTVITENHIAGQNIELRMFEPNGETKIKVFMGAADYHLDSGLLEATERLTLSGDGFRSEGSGGIFQLNNRRGFINGPVKTILTPPEKEQPEEAPPTEKKPTAMNSTANSIAALAFLGLSGLAFAEAPEPLTADELALITERSKPLAGVLAASAAPLKRDIIRTEQLAQTSDFSFRTFATQIQRPELLTIAVGDDDPAPDPPALAKAADTTRITCEGGMFFDVDKAHVVYLKNVVVKKPDFTMTAGAELKIFLAKKVAKEEPKPVAEGAPAAPKEEGKTPDPDKANKNPSSGIGSFSDVDTIVATGGVKVTRKDEKGQTLIATADTATYDAKTGDIVLRGGFPRIQQGPNILISRAPGQYARIYASGKGYFPGKWETIIGEIPKGN